MSIKFFEAGEKRARRLLPEFLKKRMNEFYIERWKGEWKGRHIMRGRLPGSKDVQLVSNDYLALSSSVEIKEAMIRSLGASQESVLMSGVFLQGDNPQKRLENRLANWVGYEAAVICQSGYAANVGLIQSLAGEEVPVYIDMNAHASLWEGIHSAGATARPFRHNDVGHFKRQLERYGTGILCVDSVYSTTGSVCALEDFVLEAKRHGCLVIVDESHSLGTHGDTGSGLVAQAGLTGCVDFLTASLAKAFAGRAGVIMCNAEFEDYFWFTARPAIFSSCLLPYEIAGLDKTLDVILRDDWRRKALRLNSEFLRSALLDGGYNVLASASQILALEAGTEYAALQLREALEERGVFGSVFCAPATAKNRAMVRMSVSAGHSLEDLQHVIKACNEIRDTVGMWSWPSTRRMGRVMQREQEAATG